jgi:hypothetical protein
VGVLVAGCGQIWSSNGTATTTREPTLPLFGYTLLPPSLTPSVWPVVTATPRLASDGSPVVVSPVALYLTVLAPVCYETPVGSLTCLGQVQNPLNVPVEQVVIEVQLLTRNGQRLAAAETSLSRMVLPAGLNGPYRVMFNEVPEGYAGAYAFARSAAVAYDVSNRYARLEIKEVSGAFTMNQYQVALSVINRSLLPVDRLTVTMTLFDREGRVTGFRQVYLDPDRRLEPGESLALTLKVIPQGPNTVTFDAFAEGLLVTN